MNTLLHHLRDFTERSSCAVVESVQHECDDGSPARTDDAAYARGAEDVRIRSSLETERAVSAVIAEMQAARSVWTKETQDRLSLEAAAGRADVEARLSRDLVHALAPFLEARQRERICAALLDYLEQALPVDFDRSVKVRGGVDETSMVVDHLGRKGLNVLRESGDDMTIDVEIGPTVVTADLGAWMRRVVEEIGEQSDVAD